MKLLGEPKSQTIYPLRFIVCPGSLNVHSNYDSISKIYRGSTSDEPTDRPYFLAREDISLGLTGIGCFWDTAIVSLLILN